MAQNNKVYVFGASGFIGNELFKSSGERKDNYLSVGRALSNDIVIDLESLDISAVSGLKEGDFFIFLAAVSSPEACTKNYELSYLINVLSTSQLIEELLGRGVNVLFTSSDVVYGRTELPVNEDNIKQPQFAYANMKAEIEDKFVGKPNFKVVRLSYVWSIADKFTKFVLQCSQSGSKVEVFEPFIRSIISISDVIKFIHQFIDRPNDIPPVVNLAGPDFMSRVELVKALAAHIELSYEVIHPEQDFYKYRPDQILMESKYLTSILGRKAQSIQSVIDGHFHNQS